MSQKTNEVLRYRVALKKNEDGKLWLSFARNEKEAQFFVESMDSFVKWLTDWQEVEVL